jgi:hypothetical protein
MDLAQERAREEIRGNLVGFAGSVLTIPCEQGACWLSCVTRSLGRGSRVSVGERAIGALCLQ